MTENRTPFPYVEPNAPSAPWFRWLIFYFRRAGTGLPHYAFVVTRGSHAHYTGGKLWTVAAPAT